MPFNAPDNWVRSLTVHHGRCNTQRPYTPPKLASPHVLGAVCTRIRTQKTHGTSLSDAASRAPNPLQYKAASAGISCVRSQSCRASCLVIHASTYPTSLPSRSLPLPAGLSLTKATQHGDFRAYYRIGGHSDHDGRHCAWSVRCRCSTLHTDRHCTESGLGRLDHMCWLRESLDLTLEYLDWPLTLPRSSAFHTRSPPAKDVS